jgi:hypothetical protein
MFQVLISYLAFHYGRAYVEGYRYLRPHGLALGFVGIPLAIIWTLIPLVIASLFFSGLYLLFIWNAL